MIVPLWFIHAAPASICQRTAVFFLSRVDVAPLCFVEDEGEAISRGAAASRRSKPEVDLLRVCVREEGDVHRDVLLIFRGKILGRPRSRDRRGRGSSYS